MSNSSLLKSNEMDDTQDSLKKYVCIEIGNSAYTEFKMMSGEFVPTEDGIFLGTFIARNKSEALWLAENSPEHEGRKFDNMILFEVV